MDFLKKLTSGLKNQKTYRIGLLQTKAYRILKYHTNQHLKEYGITSIHWALLGLLYDNPNGLRLKNLAQELGVEAPFVTQMQKELADHEFIKNIQDPEDSRAKLACLTKKGEKFVEKTEVIVRKNMKELLGGVPIGDVLSYVHILEIIVRNGIAKEKMGNWNDES